MSVSPFIEVQSGRSFTPLRPVVGDIMIGDIAHALSNQCRFSGHTRVHYSVAEHSVRVSELVHARGGSKKDQLWGLLHDASEAYLVDIPAPLKDDPTIGHAYRTAEERLMRAVCYRFELPEKEPTIVRRADETLLATEARDLMPYRKEHWGKLRDEPLVSVIQPWTHEQSRFRFLARFLELR